MPDSSQDSIRNNRRAIADIRRKSTSDRKRREVDDREKIRDLEDRIASTQAKQRRKADRDNRNQQESMSEWVLSEVVISEDDKKPLIAWMDKLERELKSIY